MKNFFLVLTAVLPIILFSCNGPVDPDKQPGKPDDTETPGNNGGDNNGGGNNGGKEKTDEELGIAAIDLGLSVEWCDRNINAVSPDDSGSYFAWGETIGKTEFVWNNYKWGNPSAGGLNKYNNNATLGKNDGLVRLESGDDAAYSKFGGKWRMPTADEWLELKQKCSWQWTKQGNCEGFKVTSEDGNTSIFLPASGGFIGSSLQDAGVHGFYWTSDIVQSDPTSAYTFWIRKGAVVPETFPRFYGMAVRPVKAK